MPTGPSPDRLGLLALARAALDLLDLDVGAADRVAHGLLALLGLLGEGDLTDHAGLLADLDLLAGAHHLDRLLLEGSLGFLGTQRAVCRPALGADMLLAQADGLLHRPLAHAGGDAHTAIGDLALADGELLLDHLHGLLSTGALA